MHSPTPPAPDLPPDRLSSCGTAHDDVEIGDLIAGAVLEATGDHPPVPVSVWRAGNTAITGDHRGLTAPLAARLLAIYTDPGDIVLDATADPTLAGAAGAGGRDYRAVLLPRPRPEPPDPRRQVALILLPWPAPTPTRGPGGIHPGAAPVDPRTVFHACSDLLGEHGHTIVIITRPATRTYREHAATIIPAAREAGLGYLHHIVAITDNTPTTPDPQHPHPTTPGRPTGEHPTARKDPSGDHESHLDLLVFVLRHGPRP